MSEENVKTIRETLTKLHQEAGLRTKEIKLDLDAARKLAWALELVYSNTQRGPSIEEKILACVDRGLEVAFVSERAGRMLPADAHSQWFMGAGWYVDLREGSDITLPIGPFETANDAWEEAFIAYNLGAR
jgi:hypothetical protein